MQQGERVFRQKKKILEKPACDTSYYSPRIDIARNSPEQGKKGPGEARREKTE